MAALYTPFRLCRLLDSRLVHVLSARKFDLFSTPQWRLTRNLFEIKILPDRPTGYRSSWARPSDRHALIAGQT